MVPVDKFLSFSPRLYYNLKNLMKRIFPILILGLAGLFPLIATAQITFGPGEARTLFDVADTIRSYAFIIGAPLVILVALIGAFYILTAGGSTEKVAKGRTILLWGAIGFVIILLAAGLSTILETIMGIEEVGIYLPGW